MEASFERIERLLASILLHDLRDAPQAEKAAVLNRAGLSNLEIANLLDTTAAVVSQQLYSLRKHPGKKVRPKPKPRRGQ